MLRLFVIWHKLCSPISIKATVVQNGPLSSSYFVWRVFQQVNHVYSLDAVIRSGDVEGAHYELLGLSWPVLPSAAELLSHFNAA